MAGCARSTRRRLSGGVFPRLCSRSGRSHFLLDRADYVGRHTLSAKFHEAARTGVELGVGGVLNEIEDDVFIHALLGHCDDRIVVEAEFGSGTPGRLRLRDLIAGLAALLEVLDFRVVVEESCERS